MTRTCGRGAGVLDLASNEHGDDAEPLADEWCGAGQHQWKVPIVGDVHLECAGCRVTTRPLREMPSYQVKSISDARRGADAEEFRRALYGAWAGARLGLVSTRNGC